MQGQNKTFSFGTPSTTAASTGFGALSTTTTTTQPNNQFSFSFNKPATTGFSGFGTSTTTTTQPQSTGGLFGSAQTTATTTAGSGGFSGFGSTQPKTATSGFSGFGGTANTSFNFGPTQQPQQTNTLFGSSTTALPSTIISNIQQTGTTDHLMNSLVNAQIFNDDRDVILAKWNQLQAFYGFGKIYYQNQTINITDDNHLTRFKTIGYSCKPSNKNEDGLVCLIVKGMQNEVKTNQNKIIETLSKIFGSSPVLQIEIDSIRSLINEKKAENNEPLKSSTDVLSKTLVTFSVIERAQNGQTRRIPSLDVFNYLNKQEAPSGALGSLATKITIKDQLNQIGILNVYPLVQLNEEQIKEYLDKPPSGINPILWEQAKRNNPNPNKLIPVPIIGFKELNKRFKLQEQENQAQKSCLYNLKEDIETINTKNRLLMNKIEQYKNKNEELEHRLLKVMINYEIRRKLGICFQEDEKYLRNVLESIYIELSSPINKEIQKQKLNEFLEIVKSYELNNLKQHQQQQIKSDNKIDLNNLEGIQHSLRDQHKIFKSLIEIINKDLNDLNLIKRNIQA